MSPSDRSFFALRHDKSRCLQLHITERRHFTTDTDPPIAQAMPFRLIDIFAFPLEQFFLTRDFPIFSSSSSSSSSSPSSFFFIFFLSHRPSALRKRGKGLIFTPNISTGDGGVHRHQAIVPFLLYDTTTKSRGLQLHITKRRHFTTATPFRVRAMWIYTALIARSLWFTDPFPACAHALRIAAHAFSRGKSEDLRLDRTCCCQSPFPSLQLLAALTASLVSYGVVTLRISHNKFHCRTSFSHPFGLELLFVAPIIL